MRSLLPASRARGAFTVVEVLIAVLLLLVFFNFVIARSATSADGARDQHARAAASSALSMQVLLFERDGAFLTDPSALAEVDGSLTYLPSVAPSRGPQQVSLAADAGQVAAAAMSESGQCWMAASTVSGAGRGSRYARVPDGGATACTGGEALGELGESETGRGSWSSARELG